MKQLGRLSGIIIQTRLLTRRAKLAESLKAAIRRAGMRVSLPTFMGLVSADGGWASITLTLSGQRLRGQRSEVRRRAGFFLLGGTVDHHFVFLLGLP